MSGIAQFNFPAFDAAAIDLRARGYEVVSPAELDAPATRAAALLSSDGSPGQYVEDTGETWGDLLARDVKLIADEGIEAIVVLPGWASSRGARLETYVGRLCGIPILAYDPDPGGLPAVGLMDLEDAHGCDTDSRVVPEGGLFDPLDPPVESLWPPLVPCPPHMADLITAADQMLAATRLPEVTRLYVDGSGVAQATVEQAARLGGETRVVNETTGGEKGTKPQRMELLPYDVLMRDVSPLYTNGAAKYEAHNWRRGYAWSLSFGAMMRHASAFWHGEDIDPEMQTPHMASVVFHALALLHFAFAHSELDDRPPIAEEG